MQDMTAINHKLKKLSESKDSESNESTNGQSESSTVAASSLKHNQNLQGFNSGAQL